VPKNADFLSQKNFSFNSNLFMKVFLDLEPKLLFFVLPLHWTKGLRIHKIDEFAHFQKSIKSTCLNMSKINFLFLEVNLGLFRWPFNQDSSWFLHSIFFIVKSQNTDIHRHTVSLFLAFGYICRKRGRELSLVAVTWRWKHLLFHYLTLLKFIITLVLVFI
jgi:hypothetical protein